MGEAELIEYQEREPQSLPLEEHGLQPAGMYDHAYKYS